MKNKPSSNSSTFEPYDVFRSDRYRSNPDNRHHSSYQKAADRVFVLSIYLLSLCIITANYGWEGALAAVFGPGLGMVFVATLITFIVEIIWPLIGSVFEWFDGH